MAAEVDALKLNANVGGYKAGENVNGRFRENVFYVTGKGGYPAGGFTFTPQKYGQLGMKTIIGTVQMGTNAASVALLMVYDYTDKLLRVINPGTGTDIIAGTDMALYEFLIKVVGLS